MDANVLNHEDAAAAVPRTDAPDPQSADSLVANAPTMETPDADPQLPKAEYLKARLADAERMLAYAADSGIEIPDTVTKGVFAARVAEATDRWTQSTALGLLSALTALTTKLAPVTGESLRLCANDDEAQRTTRSYKRVAFWLAAIIVPFSLATFITSGISKAVRADITRANELAVILTNELRPVTAPVAAGEPLGAASAVPADGPLSPGTSQKDVIEHLQEFAALIRAIYANGRDLRAFVPWSTRVPTRLKLELDPKLQNFYESAADRVGVYQSVRFFAQSVDSSVAIVYGAFAACVLPVLYALLGACAYLLRQFELQVRTRTLQDSDAHLARFLIAGIAGAVIGLFNNFKLDDGASVSPLALAFLVGYAADVFFTFLEALIQSFNRKGTTPAAQASAAPMKQS